MTIGEVINKLVGTVMIFGCVPLFMMDMFFPALFLGIGGLSLLGHKDRAAVSDPKLAKQLAELNERLAAIQIDLAGTQKTVGELTEERDFMRQLAAGPGREAAPRNG